MEARRPERRKSDEWNWDQDSDDTQYLFQRRLFKIRY